MKNFVVTTLSVLALLFTFSACSEAEAGSGDALKTTIEGHFKKISDEVGKIDTEDAAKKANTSISDLVGKITTALGGAKLLSGDGMKGITDMVKNQAGPILEKLNGLKPNLKGLVGDAISKLTALKDSK